MLAPGDFLALLSVTIEFIKSKNARFDGQQLKDVRKALKRLYFSDETIARLGSFPNIEAFDAASYEAGRASIKQRDTREDVYAAFATLEEFGRKDGLGIKAGRLLGQIMNSKMGIRHEIEATYFNIIKNGTKAETAELVEKVKMLNSSIEELDDQLGGIILAGNRNG